MCVSRQVRVGRVVRALGALAVAACGAGAQVAPEASVTSGRIEIPVTIESIRNWHLTSLGRVIEDRTYAPRACGQLASHTDANFAGGSFIAQAGFAQGEMFAATYTLPASAFPIKIDLAECIFVTSGSTVTTTTRWSVLFFEGTPTSGTLVSQDSSDDVIIPHLRIPPGTNGVNIQFSVDPGDPEQIIINDNGSRQFTMAWRIDQHHQQTQNPCFTGPPTCCNAFPCTDVSGLAQPANNWLFGVNCGSLGCPPNGGWARFNALASFCRPSGDSVMRATWSSLSCQPGVGACCLPDGTCIQATSEQCGEASGTWRGEFTDCATANCPAPSGACCFSNGFCTTLTPLQCNGAGGTYLGHGVACGSGNTCPTGACCLPDGSCIAGVGEQACQAQGGSFRGVGSTCAGACPTGACCKPDGTCITATEVQCTNQGGAWQGAGTSCGSVSCPQPSGACCLSSGFCLTVTQAVCAGIPESVWKGAFTTCADGNGNGTADICENARCVADYNSDGGVDGGDVEAFFIDWESGDSAADVNEDGGVDGGDVEFFYLAWESGSC
ncbi:MAG: hypothetical protein JNK25_00640 [Phycisphaerae bacterium]|nr:hypothetical protein [Phycisphaerae bacterium]